MVFLSIKLCKSKKREVLYKREILKVRKNAIIEIRTKWKKKSSV
jgi:hypothetical protein